MTPILLLAALAACQGAPDAEARLTRRAEAFLESLLGPGRAHVTVSARQETRSMELSSEYSTVVRPEVGLDAKGLKPKRVPPEGQSRDREATRIDLGTRVTALKALVVVDRGVGEAKLADLQRLLPGVLGLDAARGDALEVQRADLARPWPGALPLAAAAAVLALLGLLAGAWRARRRRLTALRLPPDGIPPLSGETFPEARR